MTRGDERGQATVEFALVLPLALVCLALVIQTLILVSAQITLHHDARLAARAASMSPEPATAARETLKDDDQRTEIDVDVTDLLVTVVLRRKLPVIVPLVRRVVPAIDLRSGLTMALEPPVHTAVSNHEDEAPAIG